MLYTFTGYFHQELMLRALITLLTAFAFALAAGPIMIRNLSKYKVGQPVRDDGPKSHHNKSGTPTMGGILVLLAITVGVLLWGDWNSHFTWLPLLSLWAFGAIGFVDDYKKLILKSPKGLAGRYKYLAQSIFGILFGIALFVLAKRPEGLSVLIPYCQHVISLGGLYIIWAYLVVVGSSNAVNLTDGLDGLAIVPVMLCAAALAVFGYLSGDFLSAEAFRLPHIGGSQELVILAAAVAGAGLGFLWYNSFPAQVFMGDVGSLALGGMLGVMALLVQQELLLVIMGGVFVIETISVILQVGSYKLRGGKRIFRMAPIHHHFELKGWPEPKVTLRFWIATVVLVLLALASLL
jgi:phospho-N-acetylmuramoyl-pentapeptide-transferase